MFEAVVTVLFRTVLDEEVRLDVPSQAAGNKALVASKPADSPPREESDPPGSSPIGRQALLPAPSMWN
jgi:hypothetical protein